MSPPETGIDPRLRALVAAALYDEGAFLDDGAWGEIERISAYRAAFEVRRYLGGEFGEQHARLLLEALRDPRWNEDRASVLLFHCAQGLRARSPHLDALHAKLRAHADPRIRKLAIRAECYPVASAIDDPDPEVKIAAIAEALRPLRRPYRDAVLLRALRDADPRVRAEALRRALVLPQWEVECTRLLTDPDAEVRAVASVLRARGVARRARDGP